LGKLFERVKALEKKVGTEDKNHVTDSP